MILIRKIRSLWKTRTEEQLGRVEFSNHKITYYHPQDSPQILKWNELAEVGIVTTDEGPFLEDMFFLLLGSNRERGCAIPQGAHGMNDLLPRLQVLDGFDNEVLIDAMRCTSNDRFTLWKRGGESGRREVFTPAPHTTGHTGP